MPAFFQPAFPRESKCGSQMYLTKLGLAVPPLAAVPRSLSFLAVAEVHGLLAMTCCSAQTCHAVVFSVIQDV